MSTQRRFKHPNVACRLKDIALLDGTHQPYGASVHHQRRNWAFQLYPTDAFHVSTIQWTIMMILFYFYKFVNYAFTHQRVLCRDAIRIKQLFRRLFELPERPRPAEITSLSHFHAPVNYYYYPEAVFDLGGELNTEDPFKFFTALMIQGFSDILKTDFRQSAHMASSAFLRQTNKMIGLLKDIFFTLALFDNFAKVHWNHSKRLQMGSPERFISGVHDFAYLKRFLAKKGHKFLWHSKEMMAPTGRPYYFLLQTRPFFEHCNDPDYDSSDDDETNIPEHFYASGESDDDDNDYSNDAHNHVAHN